MELIVKARNIDIEYNGKQILDIDDLEIYSYDKIGIVGKNGVGKTTLLKILLEQIKLEKAEIKFDDINLLFPCALQGSTIPERTPNANDLLFDSPFPASDIEIIAPSGKF